LDLHQAIDARHITQGRILSVVYSLQSIQAD